MIHDAKECLRGAYEYVFDRLLPDFIGRAQYLSMQKRQYDSYTQSQNDIRNLCVGAFHAHERYPYEEYLLERYSGQYVYALDFGCGMGRMMKRMLRYFDSVDGVDLMQNNLDYAQIYLSKENKIQPDGYRLFKTNGGNCRIRSPHKYHFIYSTICLQHICVHAIRIAIFRDFYLLLEEQGQCCLQMGFGFDNGIHWFDNHYGARSTNAGCDVTIPDVTHLEGIESDFKQVGFKEVQFALKESPHPEVKGYHPQWIFIHLWK